MAQQPVEVPQWDVADRMRKALREADISVQDMAEYLGVGRNTVSTWINGRIHPSVQTLRLWSLRCGVPYEWLTDEKSPRPAGPDGGYRGRARRDSNPQPSDPSLRPPYIESLRIAS